MTVVGDEVISFFQRLACRHGSARTEFYGSKPHHTGYSAHGGPESQGQTQNTGNSGGLQRYLDQASTL